MDSDYLTIPEASAYSGKPEITIRRLIKRKLAKGKSMAIKKHKKGRRFIYLISKKYLQDEYGNIKNTKAKTTAKTTETKSKKEPKPEQGILSAMERTVLILQAQLEAKDKQLENMQELLRNEQVLSLESGRKGSWWSRVFSK